MASNRNNQRNRPSIDSNRNSMVYSSDDDDDNDADSAVDQSQIRPSDLSEQAHQGRSLQFTESAHMKRLRENPNQGLTLIQNKLYCQPCKKFILPRTNAVQRHCGTEVVRNPTAASNNRSNNGSRHKAAYRVWTNNAARSQPDYTNLRTMYIEKAMACNMSMTQTAHFVDIFKRYNVPNVGTLPTTRQGLCFVLFVKKIDSKTREID